MSTSQTQDDLFSQISSTVRRESYDDMGIRRPVTWWRQEVLSGRIPYSQASPSIQSWLRYDIHLGAIEILALPQHERKAALSRIPETVRPLVEAEVKRVWTMRRAERKQP